MLARAALFLVTLSSITLLFAARDAVATVDPSLFPPPALRLTADSGASLKPRVALDPGGNAVVVWQDNRSGNNEILWQKFTLDGLPLTSALNLSRTTSSSVRPDVSCGAETSYVVWQEGEANGVGDVRFARVNQGGARIRWDVNEINLAGDPRVAARPNGYADVVWWRRAAVDQDLYYRRHQPSGAVQCQQRLNDGTIADIPKAPVIAVGEDGFAQLLWTDLGQWFSYYVMEGGVDNTCHQNRSEICSAQGNSPTIDLAGARLARLYDYGGLIYEAGQCCALAGVAGNSTSPATGTTPDTSIAVWQDTRNGNAEIYFCQYRGCTNLSGDLRLTVNSGASERPDIAVDHVTGEWVAVWQQMVDGNYEIYMTSSRLLGSTGSFLIPSATFDQSLYRNGTSVAALKVLTQSVAGSRPDLTLHATLTSNLQDVFDLGTDAFGLTAGQQHVSSFSWPVPARNQAWEFSLHLELKSGAEVLASVDMPHAAAASNLNEAEIEQRVAELMNTQCVSAVSDCASYWIGVVPVFDAAVDFVSFKDAVCKWNEAVSRGDLGAATVAGFEALLPAVEIALDAIPGAGPLAGLVVEAVDYAYSCSGTWFPHPDLLTTAAVQSQPDPTIDSLAADVRQTLSELGRDYSCQVFTRGQARLRIGVDGHWTSADTAGLTHAFLYPPIGAAVRWAHVGPQPVPVGTGDLNPYSSVTVEIQSDGAGPVDFRLLHHASGDSILAYATLPMEAGSVARMTLSDTSTTFPLELDVDGNGTTDFVYLPDGSVVGVPAWEAEKEGAARILAIGPNPFIGSTTLHYGLPDPGPVRFEVYDVSGRKRASLDGGVKSAGLHALIWDGRDDAGVRLAPGAYFVRLDMARQRSAAKLILSR